jgi:hypothetical protein
MNKLERRFGRYAISHLMAYIIGAEGIVFLLSRTPQGSRILALLQFDPHLIAQGQIWRLVGFVFIPPTFSIWVFFILYFYYMLGTRLEEEWGSFRFNVYYFAGMACTIAAAFFAGQMATPFYLNLSIFLAFATIDPDFSILLFFVIPVKVKYLAWLSWAFLMFTVLTQPLPYKVMASVSVINYFLFFGKGLINQWRGRAKAYPRRQAFQAQARQARDVRIHKCTICGITEADDPHMDFRYCSRCAGHHEYCAPHLQSHEHFKA